jgi:acetylornithine deacetylase/succinyl-diaminopimelate desuccinylase-like protein
VIGEPSSCTVRRGHRGRFEPILRVRGRSVHASVPERGINPLFTLGRFLSRLDEVEHAEDAELGPSTVAPTLVRTDQTSANVVPAELWQTLDWRAVPGETAEDICRRLEELARACAEEGAEVEVTLPEAELSTWTGRTVAMAADNPAYLLAADDPAVLAARAIVEEVTGEDRGAEPWRFATDGGHFAAAGLVPVGFGPGDELLAHTVREHVELDALETALEVNRRFARELATRVASS